MRLISALKNRMRLAQPSSIFPSTRSTAATASYPTSIGFSHHPYVLYNHADRLHHSLFASAHINATTVWRPLFFEFPTDTNTFGIDQQFLIGAYLLVSPVLIENATSVLAYLLIYRKRERKFFYCCLLFPPSNMVQLL